MLESLVGGLLKRATVSTQNSFGTSSGTVIFIETESCETNAATHYDGPITMRRPREPARDASITKPSRTALTIGPLCSEGTLRAHPARSRSLTVFDEAPDQGGTGSPDHADSADQSIDPDRWRNRPRREHSNISVNSRRKNCGGYTVGICPSDLKICACTSTMKSRPK